MIEYHSTPQDAGRTLSAYIDCPERIRNEVYVSTGYWMHLSTVKQYQELAQRAKVRVGIHYRRDIDHSVMDSDRNYRAYMARVSRKLAERIIEVREQDA